MSHFGPAAVSQYEKNKKKAIRELYEEDEIVQYKHTLSKQCCGYLDFK
jgi:hypothetical protein